MCCANDDCWTHIVSGHKRQIVDHPLAQKLIGVILLLNFAINIIEAEMHSRENAASVLPVLDAMDLVFTGMYCMELACNLFVRWWRPFFSDPWSVFDAACVLAGVVSNILAAASSGKTSGLSIIRSFRIFKIVRIFSRLSVLQRIITSISGSLGPLFYTVLIYFVVNCIYAVLASQFYSALDPEQFGSFSKVPSVPSPAAFANAFNFPLLLPCLPSYLREHAFLTTYTHNTGR
jgi:voltage-gated sodium channel